MPTYTFGSVPAVGPLAPTSNRTRQAIINAGIDALDAVQVVQRPIYSGIETVARAYTGALDDFEGRHLGTGPRAPRAPGQLEPYVGGQSPVPERPVIVPMWEADP